MIFGLETYNFVYHSIVTFYTFHVQIQIYGLKNMFFWFLMFNSFLFSFNQTIHKYYSFLDHDILRVARHFIEARAILHIIGKRLVVR